MIRTTHPQGMGRSEGDRLYVEQFDDFVEDYVQFMEFVRTSKLPAYGIDPAKTPCFIFCHSMGCVVTLRIHKALRERSHLHWLSGIAFSGPALAVDPVLNNPPMRYLLGKLKMTLPKLSGVPLDDKLVSEDPTVSSRVFYFPLSCLLFPDGPPSPLPPHSHVR